MQFDNFQQLWDMAGHGPFVWTSVLVSLVMMIWLIVRPLADRKAALQDVARDIARTAQAKENLKGDS
ncbi:heme exporter protein CcmD [Porticoccaceae bacterium]|jgi:heme exporter protein D|nr:heme exporter protein CcmD [Porticoccaceae bacterium]